MKVSIAAVLCVAIVGTGLVSTQFSEYSDDEWYDQIESEIPTSASSASSGGSSDETKGLIGSRGGSKLSNLITKGVRNLTTSKNSFFVNVGVRNDYLLQHCGGNSLKLSFPNVDYAFLGYDILRGYPLAMGSDPGFTYPIFTPNYSDKRHTGDCRYSIPRGLVILSDVSCDVSFTSSVIRTSRAFESELAVSASVSAGGWGVQFSASAGYKKSVSQVSKGEYCYILSRASCNYYVSKLEDMKHPNFDDSFLHWVHILNNTDDNNVYLEFFRKYGTHYPTQVTFGSRFVHQHKMETKELNKMESEGVNVAVSASYSGMFSAGGGFNLDSSQKKSASDFSKKVQTNVITIGAAPPSNGDAMTWASSVQQNPVPTEYKLDNIANLFTERYMNDLDVDYDTIHNKLQEKKKFYWQTIQRSEGADNFLFDLESSLLIPNWFVRADYEEIDVTYNDCFLICKNLGGECYGVSFCSNCVQQSQSKCSIFGKNARSRDWKFDERWQTIVLDGSMNLKDMVVSDTTGSAMETLVTNIQGSQGATLYVQAKDQCKQTFDDKRRARKGDKPIAYSFGFLFNESFAQCKIYGSRKILTLEVREKFRTVIQV